MNYFKTIRFHFFALFFIAILVGFAYWSLPNTFFQQDEWQTQAVDIYFISKGITGVIESFLPTGPLSHFTPLARVFSWFEHVFYYTNFASYAWQSIILHISNSLLLYYFVLSWLRKRKIACITALIFAVNSIPYQAVTWVTNENSYEIPTWLIILSLISFHRFLLRKEHKWKYLVFSLLMLFISLLFHEIGIFLFIFYPMIFFLQEKSQRRKLFSIFLSSLMLFIFIFFLMRAPFFFGFKSPLPEAMDISHPSIAVFPYRLLSISLKSFAGNFFPEKILIGLSDQAVRLAYPKFITSDNVPNPFITQSVVFDLVSYVISVCIISLILLLAPQMKEKKLSEALVWSLLFIPASLLPYAFVLGKAGYASILEPKFFYVSSIGASIIIAIASYSLIRTFSKKRIVKACLYILLSLYIISHIYAVRSNISNLVKISVQRKLFLTEIQSSYPRLPQKVIFFTQSDTAYYGMPDSEKGLPVQIGFGKILMIWYQKTEQFPGCLYEGQFLIRMLAQGYKDCGGRGFGYFRDYAKLVEAVKQNGLSPESVIAYSWSGETQRFISITGDIRHTLKDMLGLQ